jgi:hypothetical protein
MMIALGLVIAGAVLVGLAAWFAPVAKAGEEIVTDVATRAVDGVPPAGEP